MRGDSGKTALHSLSVESFGTVDKELAEEITSVLVELYSRTGVPSSRVKLLFFEKRDDMEVHLRRDGEAFARKHGFEYVPVSLGFSSMHHAWFGHPTIVTCSESISDRDRIAVFGELRHEGGHSVLHSSPIYYLLKPPSILQALATRKGVDKRVISMFFYLLTIGVKDFEVTRLLVSKGYLDCQKALYSKSLIVSEDDKEASKLAETDYSTALLLTASILKPVMGSIPLLSTKAKPELQSLIEENLALLPMTTRLLAMDAMEEWVPAFGNDTLSNIMMLAERTTIHELKRI